MMSTSAMVMTSNATSSYATALWPVMLRGGGWAWPCCNAKAWPPGPRHGNLRFGPNRFGLRSPHRSTGTGSSVCSPPWRWPVCGRGERR